MSAPIGYSLPRLVLVMVRSPILKRKETLLKFFTDRMHVIRLVCFRITLPLFLIVPFEGAYVILFGLAVWLLPQKFHIPSVKKFIFPSIIALFAFATLNIAYNLAGEAYAIVFTIPEVEKPWMIAGQ